MADLKIQQLDSIIPVVTGKTYLANSDLFLVKMAARGSAIADEDRKLRWGDLVTTLNLGQYMPNNGGTFTGDVTLNNTKAIQSNKASGGSPVKLLYLDAQDRVMVGNTTQQLRLVSPGYPIYVDPNGATSDFITTSNLPLPGSLAGGGSYTKSQSDAIVSTLVAKDGSTMTGDLTFANAKGVVGSMENGTAAALLVLDSANIVNIGAVNLQANIKSVAVPKWNNGTTAVDVITTANLPLPGALGNGGTTGAYTKAEITTQMAGKLSLTGGNMKGDVAFANTKAIQLFKADGTTKLNGLSTTSAGAILVGDGTVPLRLQSSAIPVLRTAGTGTDEYKFYTELNKPNIAELGLTDTVSKAATALQEGAFGLGGIPNHRKDAGFLTTTDKTEFFAQSGASDEQRFGGANGTGGGDPATGDNSGLGAGVHIYYGSTGSGSARQYKSASIYLREDNKLITKWSYLDSTGAAIDTKTAVVYTNYNRPAPSDLGSGSGNSDSAYTRAETAARFAQKGVNADITALNGLTGALKVGANAANPFEVTTLQQVQAMTSGTAGAVVGVVGGFIGAVMWFNGANRSYIPAGYGAGDGQVLNRADYPDTWKAIDSGALLSVDDTTWQNDPKVRGKFSKGNGTTTFRMPDYNGVWSHPTDAAKNSVAGLFLRGDGRGVRVPAENGGVGEVRANAAPNITGSFGSDLSGSAWLPATAASGALRAGSLQVNNVFHPLTGYDKYTGNGAWAFDASLSNPTYSNTATEVRPNSVQGIWIVRLASSFEAANTSFTVYNGVTSTSANTDYRGGSLISQFSVAGQNKAQADLHVVKKADSTVAAVIEIRDDTGSVLKNVDLTSYPIRMTMRQAVDAGWIAADARILNQDQRLVSVAFYQDRMEVIGRFNFGFPQDYCLYSMLKVPDGFTGVHKPHCSGAGSYTGASNWSGVQSGYTEKLGQMHYDSSNYLNNTGVAYGGAPAGVGWLTVAFHDVWYFTN